MLPVVKGPHHTKVQMLVYTLLLLPLTILPTLSGHQGLLYAGAALLLGARLLWYCLKLLKETGPSPLPWRMYKYSLLYLALLFIAMGIDRYFPIGHFAERPETLILGK
jgi:protoheme IX farnesyltransferase